MRIWLAVITVCIAMQADAAQDIALFNGKNFSGWTFYLEEKDYNAGGKGNISDFASVKPGGVIEMTSTLHGALMTKQNYLNYKLHLEWRFPDPQGKNNSGLFLRIRPPFVWDMQHGVQAPTYMVQIEPPDSGDLWVLGYSESKLKTDTARAYKPFGDLELTRGGHIRRHLKAADAEKPAPQWNSMDVTLQGKTIQVWINGELVNEGTELVDLPGRIGLESETGTVQYRNIHLTPLPD